MLLLLPRPIGRRSVIFLAVLVMFTILFEYVFDFNLIKSQWAKDRRRRRPNGPKLIALGSTYFGSSKWPVGPPEACDLKRCEVVYGNDAELADAVVYHAWDVHYPWVLLPLLLSSPRPGQVRVWYNWEPPTRIGWFSGLYDNFFHWTASYRVDSDVFVPYGSLSELDASENKVAIGNFGARNFAAGRSKIAFIVTSHCKTRSRRMEFAMELKRLLGPLVDVFGACSGIPCPFDCDKKKLATMYKFYLALENSQCRDYITEKSWTNAIAHNMVPIVNGGIHGSKDYLKILPAGSFIHVNDYTTTAALVDHLMILHKNDTLYNRYFEWKLRYKVDSYEHTHWVCKICDKLHNMDSRKSSKSAAATTIPKPKRISASIRKDMRKFWNVSADCVNAGVDTTNLYTTFLSYFAYFTGLAT